MAAKKQFYFGLTPPATTTTTTTTTTTSTKSAFVKNDFSFGPYPSSSTKSASEALQKLRDELALYAEKQKEVGKQFEICMKEVKEVRVHLESKETVFELWKEGDEKKGEQQEQKITVLQEEVERIKSNVDLMGEFKDKMEKSHLTLKKVEEDMGLMKEQSEFLKHAVENLRQNQRQVPSFQHQLHQPSTSAPSSAAPTPSSFYDICNELEMRQQKRKNLILFGVNEGTKADKEIASQLLEDVAVTSNVQGCYRLGKKSEVHTRPRPLVIQFVTVQDRNEVQKSLRNLKGKSIWNGVSIRPDLTKIQYQEEKKVFDDLCKEMKIKNQTLKGEEKWKIVNRGGAQKLVFG